MTRMGSLLYTYMGYGTKDLVHISGGAKRNSPVEIFSYNFHTHIYFSSDHPKINVAMQIMKEIMFEEIPVAATNFHQCKVTIHHWMECYNVTGEPDEEDPRT